VSRVLGIDVGGTKIAAGIVDRATGAIDERRQIATAAERGETAVLAAVVALAASYRPDAIGLGVPELVDPAGRTHSAYTLDWCDRDLAAELGVVAPCRVDSDVRAAALAEGRFGAGRGRGSFLYVTVSTGISHALVIDGVPWAGARGMAIITGAPPVEDVASGRALALLAGRARAEDVVDDPAHAAIVATAAEALGLELARLVNAVDPEALVIGGGLGLNRAFHDRTVAAVRHHVWPGPSASLEVLAAALGADAGIVGAALLAPAP
jgi:glucokinase